MEHGALYVMTYGMSEMQWLSVDNWVYPQQVGRCMHYAFATVDVLVLYTEMITYTQRIPSSA